MKKEREDRPYFDENKNYLDDDPKPLFDKHKIIEEKVVIKRIRKQFLSSNKREFLFARYYTKLI